MEFSTRLKKNQPPPYSKHIHYYQSPHYNPTPAFNFWRDLEHNVKARNDWDRKGDVPQGGLSETPFMSQNQPYRARKS
jgi:hypothetical protein